MSACPKPNLRRELFEMIFPDVPIALRCRGSLVFRDPGQVNALDEIADRDDSFGGNCAGVDRCHVPVGFGHDVCGRTLSPRRDRAKLVRNPLALDVPAKVSVLPIAHIPTIPDAHDLPVLFSGSH